ncbi:MAG: AAA family ATPase [Firmicutes bacterium]|nr:AAA family ATPase [Bacillota bacterium]
MDWFDSDVNDRFRRETRRKIKEASCGFNEREEGNYAFVHYIRDEEIRMGLIVENQKKAKAIVPGFLDALELEIGELRVTEITFDKMERCLNAADREDYVEDADDVLNEFGLGELSQRRFESRREMILPEGAPKEKMVRIAEDYLAEGSLVPELDRIFAGRKEEGGTGHPVHYMIRTDVPETQEVLLRTLARSLYENKRLDSRRCRLIEIHPGGRFSWEIFEAIYRSFGGGCVAVRFAPVDESEDSVFLSGELDAIRRVCSIVKKYRNQVLTVLLLPREAEKTRGWFYDSLEGVSLVEIREELAGEDRARAFLQRNAEEENIEADEDLLGRIEEGEEYSPYDLNRIFEEWMSRRMKSMVYPQYLDITTAYEKEERKKVRGSAINELQEMVGLTEAKDVIRKAVKYYKMQQIYRDRGIVQDRPAMHMVFMGNPGTAKTSVARLFARIMKENGLLSRGHLVEVGRSDLVGRYVGWTAKTVKEKFQQAKGGVLFIDEAYSLVDYHNGSFGDEAINTIVQEMENRREDLVVILAGYPNEMKQFLDRNPGLRSRIAFHVPFADYNAEELCQIASLIGKSKGVELSEEAMEQLRIGFEIACRIPDFGNGRYVRNVLELAKMNQAERILEIDPDRVTEKELRMIEAEDIDVPKSVVKTQHKTIGFAV